MYLELFFVCGISIAVCAVLLSYLAIRRAKRQIRQMAEALKDIRAGNGNRRILSEAHELTAPLAYGINDVVRAYEEKLAAFSQAEETNKQLMTSLSHDVRTPLTTLIGYLDAAHKGTVEGKEREEYIGTARRKAHDLKAYIDVLFDWFKLNSDEFVLEMETAEAGELTRDILIDWIPVFEDGQAQRGELHGIGYTVDIPERAFPVRLDKEGYRRILNNLIQNILSHAQASEIWVTLSEEEGLFQCRVRDNGVGIRSGDLGHIFERLYKCDKGRSEKGSGLGLSIVKQLTQRMGGSVRAESKEGEGTEFILEFPMAR